MSDQDATPVEAAPEAPAVDETPDVETPDTDDSAADDAPVNAAQAREKSRKANAENKKLKAELAALRAKYEPAPEAVEEEAPAKDDTAERLSATEKERDGHALEVARLRVALRKGLTEAQAKRLVGGTEEDLETDADELLSMFGARGPVTRPKESLRGGSTPDEEIEETDPVKLAGKIRRGY